MNNLIQILLLAIAFYLCCEVESKPHSRRRYIYKTIGFGIGPEQKKHVSFLFKKVTPFGTYHFTKHIIKKRQTIEPPPQTFNEIQAGEGNPLKVPLISPEKTEGSNLPAEVVITTVVEPIEPGQKISFLLPVDSEVVITPAAKEETAQGIVPLASGPLAAESGLKQEEVASNAVVEITPKPLKVVPLIPEIPPKFPVDDQVSPASVEIASVVAPEAPLPVQVPPGSVEISPVGLATSPVPGVVPSVVAPMSLVPVEVPPEIAPVLPIEDVTPKPLKGSPAVAAASSELVQVAPVGAAVSPIQANVPPPEFPLVNPNVVLPPPTEGVVPSFIQPQMFPNINNPVISPVISSITPFLYPNNNRVPFYSPVNFVPFLTPGNYPFPGAAVPVPNPVDKIPPVVKEEPPNFLVKSSRFVLYVGSMMLRMLTQFVNGQTNSNPIPLPNLPTFPGLQ